MFKSVMRKEPLLRLLAYLKPYKLKIFFAIVAMLFSAAGSSLMALLMGKVTDLGFYQQNDGMVALWAPFALIGISLIHGGGQFGSAYLLQQVSQSVLYKVRTLMFENMIRWPDETVQQQQSGRVTSKFLNEASMALSGASEFLTVIVRDSLQIIALLCVLFWHNWQLTLVTFVVAPALIFILRLVSRKLKKLTFKAQDNYGHMISVLSQTFQGQRLVKIYDAYKFETEQFRRVNKEMTKLAVKAQLIKGLGTPATQFVTMCAVAIVVTVALLQARAGLLSMGDFVTYLSAMLLMQPAIKKLASLNGSMAKMSAASESLFAMIDIAKEEDPGTKDIGRSKGEVEFRNISYQYPNTKHPSLQNISLKVAPGEMIAFVGSSGAGKTTMINLIARFLNPVKGEILFDGVSQNEMTLDSIRRQIALVSQEVLLFDATIGENIAYGVNNTATKEEILKAAEAAYLLPLIESLPEGLDTRIGEKGAKLSGGQRQRVSIARALLKNAPILLLDEATSALDTESEKYIQASLEKLMAGRTSFVVAHRLSTIINADKIVVFDKGQIAEIGNHVELMAKGGIYAKLYKIQFDKEEKAKKHAASHHSEEEAAPAKEEPNKKA